MVSELISKSQRIIVCERMCEPLMCLQSKKYEQFLHGYMVKLMNEPSTLDVYTMMYQLTREAANQPQHFN